MSERGNHLIRDFVGYGCRPPNPNWPGGARLAVNIVINYEEGSEPSFPDGDSETESGLTEGGSGAFAGRDLAANRCLSTVAGLVSGVSCGSSRSESCQ